MKRASLFSRTFSLLVVIALLVGVLTTASLAASVTLSAGTTNSAFFSQTINSYVTVNQTAATWRNEDKTIEWTLYTSTGDVVRSMVLLTGSDSADISTKSAYSGLNHRLTFTNNYSTSVAVVYTYTLN